MLVNRVANVAIRQFGKINRVALELEEKGGKIIARVPKKLAGNGQHMVEDIDIVKVQKAQEELARRVSSNGGKVLQDEIVFNTEYFPSIGEVPGTSRFVTIKTPRGTIIHEQLVSGNYDGALNSIAHKQVIRPDGKQFDTTFACYANGESHLGKPLHITSEPHYASNADSTFGTHYPSRVDTYKNTPYATRYVNRETGEVTAAIPSHPQWSIERWGQVDGKYRYIPNKEKESIPLDISIREYDRIMQKNNHPDLGRIADELGLDTTNL